MDAKEFAKLANIDEREIPKPMTPEIALAAVKQNGDALRFVNARIFDK